MGSAFLCVMKRLSERSGLILFLLRARAGGFIAADSGKAKEGHVKHFEDVIFHTIPLVLFCPFLMKMKSADFCCKRQHFSQSVIKQEVCMGTVAHIFRVGAESMESWRRE